MKPTLLMTVALVLGLTGSMVHAADDCCPTEEGKAKTGTATVQPAANMPEGHPDISGGAQGKMPPGHPPMGGGQGQMPPGHPPMGGGGMGMPGPIDENAPTVQGQIAIRAIQSTANAPVPSGSPVTVELYHRGQPVQKLEAKLDEHGVVTLEEVPIRMPVQPLVTITHGGVEYQAVGQMMDPTNLMQRIDVPVYEATDERPALESPMRHVIVRRSPAGLEVQEMLVIKNPSDRAWLGEAANEAGKRVTFRLPLPSEAQDIRLGRGFHSCCTEMVDGTLVYSMALQPGGAEYRFAYTIPATDGDAQIQIASPVDTRNMIVFMPDDSSTVTAEGLESLGKMQAGQGMLRGWKGVDVPAGQSVKLKVTGLPEVAPAASQEAAQNHDHGAETRNNAPKAIAAVGGGTVLVIGTAVMFMKPRKSSTKS